ncbi:MAG: hypothetical protein V3V14_12755 [Saprospiraceae bacterium]
MTDRGCFSATTSFIYSVDPIEQIKTIGQRTGGGSGSVTDGFLLMVGIGVLSTSEFFDYKGRHLDDGVEPDNPVVLDLEDMTKDEVLEAAILELK